jgi:bacitracin synthase 3
MNIPELLNRLKNKKIHINLNGDKLKVSITKEDLSEDELNYIKSNKKEILKYLKSNQRSNYLTIPTVKKSDTYKVSHAQKRLWVLDKMLNGISPYNIAHTYRVKGELNINALEKSIQIIISRHEILRTTFIEKNGEPVQKVNHKINFKLNNIDFSKKKNKDVLIKHYVESETTFQFDLSKELLIRVILIKESKNSYILVINIHHIIFDGWSTSIFINELSELYNTLVKNTKPTLDILNIQYKDYSNWHNNLLKNEEIQIHKNYWLKKLGGELPILNLPTDKPRPIQQTFVGNNLTFSFNKDLTKRIKDYSIKHGVSQYIVLQAITKILLSKYTNQEDIIIGSINAGRNHPDLENQIGFYVNTLVLRDEIKSNESFDQIIEKVKNTTYEAFEHQIYPFDKLVEDLKIEKDMSRSAIFDVMMIMQNNEESDLTKINNLNIEEYPTDYKISKFDITISFYENKDNLQCNIGYNTDLFNKEFIERMCEHTLELSTNIIKNPEEQISKIDMLTAEEKKNILNLFNNTNFNYSTNTTIAEMFEQQVKRTPDNIAVIFEDKRLTYKELNQKANMLADHLRDKYTIKPDDLIAVMMERNEWMIIAILAILKSGAGYVPIDPKYPAERIEYILNDSNVKTLLVDRDKLDFKINSENITNSEIYTRKISNLKKINNERSIAYVIYTSGTTGNPKGVMVEHKNFINLIHSHTQILKDKVGTRATQIAGIGFDAMAFEVWPCLTTGGSLYIVNEENKLDPNKLIDWISKNKIEISFQPTPLTEQLLKMNWPKNHKLKSLLTAGDKLSSYPNKNHKFDLYNLYGPTEDTVWSTYYNVPKIENITNKYKSPFIGKPTPNKYIYILDKNNNLQPIGIPGELYIGGAGLARGYINRDDLTKEKFVDNPFRSGEKMYRSGDLAKWTEDGNIEFLGRVDFQVKIRGFRIELGEIESSLIKHKYIDDSLVIARDNEFNVKELVAYIVSKDKVDVEEVRNFLKNLLPDYMVPAYFVVLNKFPLNANGKIDRKALPQPEIKLDKYKSASNDLELKLLNIAKGLLGIKKLGVNNNLFHVGLDSIKAIQFVSRSQKEGIKFSVSDIFKFMTIENLCPNVQLVKNTRKNTKEITGTVKLTPIQKWFFYHSTIKSINQFNQYVLFEMNDNVEEEIFQQTMEKLIEHHDALRMKYIIKKNNVEQFNKPIEKNSFILDTFIVRNKSEVEKVLEQQSKKLNLEKGELVKAAVFTTKTKKYLSIIIHHLVIDGVSWRILLEDFEEIYKSIKNKDKLNLFSKTTSFKEWSSKIQSYSQGKKLKNEKLYWNQIVNNKIKKLPIDFKVAKNALNNKDYLSFNLSKKLTKELIKDSNSVYDTEINDLLLSALVITLNDWSKETKFMINLEAHGREDIFDNVDVSRTVGWFTTFYPIILKSCKAISENIIATKQQLRNIPNKGIGYGILKYISQEKYNIHPEISFNYLGEINTNSSDSKLLQKVSLGGSGYDVQSKQNMIEFNSKIDSSAELVTSILFNLNTYKPSTIRKLGEMYNSNLEKIIKHCKELRTNQLTNNKVSLIKPTVSSGYEVNANLNNLLIEFKKAQTNKEVFFLPHWTGMSIFFHKLLIKLNKEFNAYGIDYDWNKHKTKMDLNPIVQDSLDLINSVAKSKELMLIGYSFGGFVGFELTKKLERLGYNVKLVIIDSFLPDKTHKYKLSNIKKEIDILFADSDSSTKNNFVEIRQLGFKILEKYKLKGKIKADVVFLEAQDFINKSSKFNSDLNWKGHSLGKFKKHPIPGDHFTIFDNKNIDYLANTINKFI